MPPRELSTLITISDLLTFSQDEENQPLSPTRLLCREFIVLVDVPVGKRKSDLISLAGALSLNVFLEIAHTPSEQGHIWNRLILSEPEWFYITEHSLVASTQNGRYKTTQSSQNKMEFTV